MPPMPPQYRPRDGLQSQSSDLSARLRPYEFHGVHLSATRSTTPDQVVGDCPFCGRAGKFSVNTQTTKWKCWTCGSGSDGEGNAVGFIRFFYGRAVVSTLTQGQRALATLAADRRLLAPETLTAWGVALDPGGTWLIPGYNPAKDNRLDQVYRRVRVQDSWRLLPTPGVWREGAGHSLHMPARDFDAARPNIVICEGPWDGMVVWETWDRSAQNTNIVAVPGCTVWREEWTQMCRGKVVTLLYDSDHPREAIPGSGRISRAGYDGMERVAKRLSGTSLSVRFLRWGEEGYNPNTPSGWDVRDELGAESTLAARQEVLAQLLEQVEDAPREWFVTAAPHSVNGHVTSDQRESVEALPCETWAACEEAWRADKGGALQWRPELGDAMCVLLAVCASTKQAGNQLFLDLIGSPGSAKTTLCRGLLVSKHCIHLENMTKLISGYKKRGKDGEESDKDCSFLARANGKTWVTCEFDTLANSPQYRDLMGKVRRIFDGETSATYGNDDKDRIYTALRTPWIRAGTPKMMDHDQSQLGDRFLRFCLTDPEQSQKRSIALAALRSERAAMVQQANCVSGSILDARTQRAYALTGGYVDWLRANVEDRIGAVEVSESVEEYCVDLAELSADLRARPTDEKKQVESYDVKELPTRLARQNIRLATCLAVVLNKSAVDADVLRILRKVALDTAIGHSLSMVEWLSRPNPKMPGMLCQETGIQQEQLAQWCKLTTPQGAERLDRFLNFLQKIGVMEPVAKNRVQTTWRLTQRVYELYGRVMVGV